MQLAQLNQLQKNLKQLQSETTNVHDKHQIESVLDLVESLIENV